MHGVCKNVIHTLFAVKGKQVFDKVGVQVQPVEIFADTLFDVQSAISVYPRRFERKLSVIRRFHCKPCRVIAQVQFGFVNIPFKFQKRDVLFFERVRRHIANGRGNDILVCLFLNPCKRIYAQLIFEIIERRIFLVFTEVNGIVLCEKLAYHVGMIPVAIPANKIHRIFARVHARIFRADEIVVEVLQYAAVIDFFIQSAEIFFVEIVRFDCFHKLCLNVNLVIVIENIFGRLCRNARLELVEFLFHAFPHAFRIALRFLL